MLFPLPVRPTTPRTWPAGSENETSSSASGPSPYENETRSNATGSAPDGRSSRGPSTIDGRRSNSSATRVAPAPACCSVRSWSAMTSSDARTSWIDWNSRKTVPIEIWPESYSHTPVSSESTVPAANVA